MFLFPLHIIKNSVHFCATLRCCYLASLAFRLSEHNISHYYYQHSKSKLILFLLLLVYSASGAVVSSTIRGCPPSTANTRPPKHCENKICFTPEGKTNICYLNGDNSRLNYNGSMIHTSKSMSTFKS